MGKELYTTKELARLLQVPYHKITKILFDGKIEPPALRVGAGYLWARDEIEQASWVIRKKSADDLFPSEKKQFLS